MNITPKQEELFKKLPPEFIDKFLLEPQQSKEQQRNLQIEARVDQILAEINTEVLKPRQVEKDDSMNRAKRFKEIYSGKFHVERDKSGNVICPF